MVTSNEYKLSLLFWGTLSLFCFFDMVLDFKGLAGSNIFDSLACGVVCLFGIVRIVLSTMQVRGRHFYGSRDLFDACAGLLFMIAVPALIYSGNMAVREPGDETELTFRMQWCMVSSFLLFLYVALKGFRKYRKARQSLLTYKSHTGIL